LGSLITVMLSRLELTINECINHYLETIEKAFKCRRSDINIFRHAKDKWTIKGAYSTNCLEEAIKKLVREKEGDEDVVFISLIKPYKV